MTDIPACQPIDTAQPCGPSLDYDPLYLLVMGRLAPRIGVQYGNFVDLPAAPDWSAIARDCEGLMRRTHDIPLMVGWCRVRLALAHAPGLAQALVRLRSMLERWPDDVHPQLRIDGTPDPAVRANAVAALADPDGLLGEIGEIEWMANGAMRLTVRDVERSRAKRRPPDAVSPEVVDRLLDAARQDAGSDSARCIRALGESAVGIRAIDAWSRAQLGDHAPSLARLLDLLSPFEMPSKARERPSSAQHAAAATTPSAHARQAPNMTTETQPTSGARHDAAASIRSARQWFELHEPSSPIAVILKQAERMVGQRFVQVADAIPLELLRQWDERRTDIDE